MCYNYFYSKGCDSFRKNQINLAVEGVVKMIVKLAISGGEKTLNQVYKEMIHNHEYKESYDRIYNNFIKDILGYKRIKDLTSNDIDYFYVYLTNKTYNGHLYSQSYIIKIMNLLKNIFDYGIENKYINTNLVKIKLYFTKNY